MEKNKLPKTYEEACVLVGERPMNEEEMAKILRPDEIARRKLTTIAKALNGPDWEPDWYDCSQAKWHPWFCMGGCASVSVCIIGSLSGTLISRLRLCLGVLAPGFALRQKR